VIGKITAGVPRCGGPGPDGRRSLTMPGSSRPRSSRRRSHRRSRTGQADLRSTGNRDREVTDQCYDRHARRL